MRKNRFTDHAEWMAARRGKITGSRVGEIIPKGGLTKEMIGEELTNLGIEFDKKLKKEDLEMLLPKESERAMKLALPKKKDFYSLIAERICLARPAGENRMARGNSLEGEAVARYAEFAEVEVANDFVMWMRDDNESIAVSPDGTIGDDTEAVEAKCLDSGVHIKTYLTREIPEEYLPQRVQYFAVNDNLQKLHFAFYDPSFPDNLAFFVITVTREEVASEIEDYLQYQRMTLLEVNRIVNELTF